jgi:glucosyl-3-phosphoglycerate phosphatase
MSFSKKLTNTYFVLRHGTSIANEKNIIVSDPASGIASFGLTAKGKQEVNDSIVSAKDIYMLGADTVMYSSDFKRTLETAEIVAKVLEVPHVIHTSKLRERFFGALEGRYSSNYKKVWEDDSGSVESLIPTTVESTDDVRVRLLSLIDEIEKNYARKNILLVSHGDVLQILQTIFEDIPSQAHRSIEPLLNAEIRKLT